MAHKNLTQALLEALDLGISVQFEKETSRDVLVVRMQKKIDGFAPIEHVRYFTRREVELARFDIVASEVENATRMLSREEEKLKVAS